MPRAIETMKYEVGRQGFKIPTVEYRQRADAKNLERFLGFFRGVWELNMGRKSWDIGSWGVSNKDKQGYLWVPPTSKQPVVRIGYNYKSPERQYDRAIETHTVGTLEHGAPATSSLTNILSVEFVSSYGAGYAGARDGLVVVDDDQELKAGFYHPNDQFYKYNKEDITIHKEMFQKLGKVVDLLIEK